MIHSFSLDSLKVLYISSIFPFDFSNFEHLSSALDIGLEELRVSVTKVHLVNVTAWSSILVSVSRRWHGLSPPFLSVIKTSVSERTMFFTKVTKSHGRRGALYALHNWHWIGSIVKEGAAFGVPPWTPGPSRRNTIKKPESLKEKSLEVPFFFEVKKDVITIKMLKLEGVFKTNSIHSLSYELQVQSPVAPTHQSKSELQG
ncbi:unnamed protein product [Cuscuta campestris]|uniref:Uncharacterized protein n=1 Tax=Cuscuta campestris TaxID=132261 RepID=A0A484N8L5_9ASTE|nr:unnamed protein product [Cuscuta campestris]